MSRKEINHFFTGEEIAAIEEVIPMTEGIFLSIMKKCEEIGDDARPVTVPFRYRAYE